MLLKKRYRQLSDIFVEFLNNDNGQAMAEYIILIIMICLPLIATIVPLKAAITAYLDRVVSLLALPIP